VRMLARLHKGLRQVDDGAFSREDSLLKEYGRHNAELRRARNFVRKVRHKSEFELAMMETFSAYYEQAMEAQRLLEQWGVQETTEGFLCHGEYSHHHILYDGDFVMVTDFMAMTRGIQVSDLYYLMRKAMEKQGFDCRIGHKMLNEYDRILPLTDEDHRYLYIRFLYPEKYWKQINYYFNSNKAWIPARSTEKIRNLQCLEPDRQRFLNVLKAGTQ
ncbi:MAG: spore coat protein CotS, partial [Lachnospiraceae bacterium]|nr:spore coat protein CotS [Lachnospiraceae bacterium]